MKAFLVRGTKEGSWEDPRMTLTLTLRRVKQLLTGRGESFVLRRKGGEVSAPRDLKGTAERLKALLAKSAVGEAYILRGRLNTDPVQVKVIDLWPPPATNVCGTPPTRQYVALVRAKFPKARFAGTCVCKKVSGTSTWSDHAYGAAVDYFESWPVMWEMFHWTAAEGIPLQVKYALLGDQAWSPIAGFHKSSGEYHAHLHVSFIHGPDRIAC